MHIFNIEEKDMKSIAKLSKLSQSWLTQIGRGLQASCELVRLPVLYFW